MGAVVQEKVGDLILDHAPAQGPARRLPLLLVHGMNGGSWYLRTYLEAAALQDALSQIDPAQPDADRALPTEAAA